MVNLCTSPLEGWVKMQLSQRLGLLAARAEVVSVRRAEMYCVRFATVLRVRNARRSALGAKFLIAACALLWTILRSSSVITARLATKTKGVRHVRAARMTCN